MCALDMPKYIRTQSTRPTRTPSRASRSTSPPNAVELSHTGDIYASFTQNAKVSMKVPKGSSRQHEPEGEAARYRDAFVSPRRRDQEMLANVPLYHRRTLQEQERVRRGTGVPNASQSPTAPRTSSRPKKGTIPTLHLNFSAEGGWRSCRLSKECGSNSDRIELCHCDWHTGDDRFGVGFTKPLCCSAESHLPVHCALHEAGNLGFRAQKTMAARPDLCQAAPERHQRQERWLDPTIFTDDKARVIFKDDNARDVKEVPALFKKNYHPFGFSKPDPVNRIHILDCQCTANSLGVALQIK